MTTAGGFAQRERRRPNFRHMRDICPIWSPVTHDLRAGGLWQTAFIAARAEQLYTSTQCTIEFLHERFPKIRRLFVLGTPSMSAAFAAAGFELVPDSPDAEPDAVVVGFDLSLTYPRLCRAAWWIQQGKPYFATNPDRVCPTDQQTVLVDCGAICAALTSRRQAATWSAR